MFPKRQTPTFAFMAVWLVGGLAALSGWSFVAVKKDDFKATQMEFGRVKSAYAEKSLALRKLFSGKGLEINQSSVMLRAFKHEKQLELWAKPTESSRFQLVKTYAVCFASGEAGPKRQTGDGQVPEGFYTINRWNPQSSFHLSLGINYPNASDRILADRKNPGGDIFIHGDCVSIGCMAMTDDRIKEIYIAFVEARNAGQASVPVHIFPARPGLAAWQQLLAQYADDKAMLAFWQNLKAGHDAFERLHTLPRIRVDAKGGYLFN